MISRFVFEPTEIVDGVPTDWAAQQARPAAADELPVLASEGAEPVSVADWAEHGAAYTVVMNEAAPAGSASARPWTPPAAPG